MWDETTAGKGSNEVGSTLKINLENNPKAKTVWMVSDACGGQMRNKYTEITCLYLVQTISSLEEIKHILMVSGHSYGGGHDAFDN